MRDEHEDYRVMTPRRRILVAGLAVATAATVVLTLVAPPGGSKTQRAPVPECSASQPRDCVGGKADVIFVPLAAASSASR